MCASNVYVLRGKEGELLMKDVAEIKVEGETLRLVGLLGEEKEVRGRLVRLDLEGHAIYVEVEQE